MPRPCATLCQGRPRWHKVPQHKVTRHKVTRRKVLAQGCQHKALAPGHEHISWPRTDHENDNSPMQIMIISCVRGNSETLKRITVHAFLVILRPAANFSPTSKNRKTVTVLCISYDSGATRRPPPTSEDMKMITVLCSSIDSETIGLLPPTPEP